MAITKSHTPSGLKALYHDLLKDDPNLFTQALEQQESVYVTRSKTNLFALVIEKNKHKILSALISHAKISSLVEQLNAATSPFITMLKRCNQKTLNILSTAPALSLSRYIRECSNEDNKTKLNLATLIALTDINMLITYVDSGFGYDNMASDLTLKSLLEGDYSLFLKLYDHKAALQMKMDKNLVTNFLQLGYNTTIDFNELAFIATDKIISEFNNSLDVPVTNLVNDIGALKIQGLIIKGTKLTEQDKRFVRRSINNVLKMKTTATLQERHLKANIKTAYLIAKETNSFDEGFTAIVSREDLECILSDSTIEYRTKTIKFSDILPLLKRVMADREHSLTGFCIQYLTEGLGDIKGLVCPSDNVHQFISKINSYNSRTKQYCLVLSILKYGFEETISHIEHVGTLRELLELGFEPYDVLLNSNNNKIVTEAMKKV